MSEGHSKAESPSIWHLVGHLGVCVGSGADENPVPRLRLLLRAKQTFSAEKQMGWMAPAPGI